MAEAAAENADADVNEAAYKVQGFQGCMLLTKAA